MKVSSHKRVAAVISIVILVVVAFFTNCSEAPSTEKSSALSSNCNVGAHPKSIDEVVNLINSLPKPVSLNCFLQSLSRPLNVFLTQNSASAQPAVGVKSPRVFIISNPLILSVVPAGPGRMLLELSQYKSATQSLKGEIEFPIIGQINRSLPFDTIRNGNTGSSSCVSCHQAESRDTTITYATAFQSNIIRPDAYGRVSVANLITENDTCNISVDAYRCSILSALLDHGAVNEGVFP